MKLFAVQLNGPSYLIEKCGLTIWLILLFFQTAFSQPPVGEVGYFFPIRPGERNYLAGTMGELRNSHFHGGLDIRTGGRIGLPVYATQSGYISRVQVTAGGFGHALYLTHDDGNISVYGHLNLFGKDLEAYLRSEQYKAESYEIRLYPEPQRFRFERGDVIAFSGNSGSSSGPHLHFEIRDSNHRFLNPLEFGFAEIKDEISPILKSIAFVTKEERARVNGSFGIFDFEVIRTGGKFTTRKPIELRGSIGVEIYHYDNQNGSYSRNGIPEIVMFVDGDTIFHEVKERMSFNKNRNILVHYDYPLYTTKRRRYNKLFIEDGNELDIYKKVQRSYKFDENPHEIRIVLRDNHNNFSEFVTNVNNRKIVYPEVPVIRQGLSITENYLQFKSADSISTLYHHLHKTKLKPYQKSEDRYFYLWDLRKALPDSVSTSEETINPNFYVSIPSGYDFNFYNGDFDISTGRRTLFDTLYLRFEKRYDTLRQLEVFQFKNSESPFKTNATVTLKPSNKYDGKTGVFTYGKKLSYVVGERLENGYFRFETRELGSYTIAYDTIPPKITPINWSTQNLKLKISDDLSGIKSYRATIDGNFLLMRYEAKSGTLLAQPNSANNPISGEFILEVEDQFGNQNKIIRKL